MNKDICLIAILKDEEFFIDEWLLYHHMIGIDHFFLYDDDPLFHLNQFVTPHSNYVTVINWYGQDRFIEGRMNQTKAYSHAVEKYAWKYQWVIFLDADEFIVLKRNENIKSFLSDFDDCNAVSLNWHVFGHNGYYNNPKDLITSSLTRRMYMPSKNVKTFTRPETIAYIGSPHFCRLKFGKHVDSNKQPYTNILYPGRTEIAHINHYQCRSFQNWMNRVKRGDVNFKDDNSPLEQRWRLTEESCLKQFVTTVALDKNEYVDEYMLKYKIPLQEAIKKIIR